jgi:rare lipoprotein A
VNDRGPFVDNRIIDLSHEAARELGYDRKGLAHVRVRYIGPAPALANDVSRYAYLAPKAPAPAVAPAPPRHQDPQVEFAAQPLIKPPAMIVEAALAPLPKAAPAAARAPLIGDELPALGAQRFAASPPAAAPADGGVRIQVGAFSTPENAEKAVAQLASTGTARIEPLTTRSGATLYRVVLEGGPDEGAEALRHKVAESGFADARVIGR